MSIHSQNLFKCSTHFKICCLTNSIPRIHTSFSLPISSKILISRFVHAHNLHSPYNSSSPRIYSQFGNGAFESQDVDARSDGSGGDFNLESLLLYSELISMASSAVFFAVFVVNFVVSSLKKTVGVLLMGDRGLVWGLPFLVATVVFNAWIRRRQWNRMCGQMASGSLKVNLLDRIEKLDEDLRSSMTLIRALSRKLEKLVIRFMVTRKTVRDSIAETAALAQRNFEDTRTLALQEDILEKELLEMQKVLLAMQGQQQKQLELIVAIGEKEKLIKSKQALVQERTRIERHDSANEESKELETFGI